MDLKGKRALVTGGSRGIGRAIVEALAESSADVAIVYYSRKDKAEELQARVQRRGVRAFTLQGDVSSWESAKSLVDRAIEVLGGIDILINSAGINGTKTTLPEISEREWYRVISTNLSGSFFTSKAAEAQLRANKGKIVNLSSIAAKMGGTLGSHYAASKGGISSMTFAMATELAPDVMVNAIAPGPVDTDLIAPEVKEKLGALTPFNRIARAEEIAHTAIYLLENDFVTGEIIDVNAGRYKD
ncbi:MAG TPA: SDR family oxidoreductase [Sediminispirochaeta sp.]|nr:SDR family oxidoreductase [Sediminispirochaeta sp.]